MVWVKTVVAHENHIRVGTRKIQEHSKHQIVEPISRLDYIAEKSEIFVRNPILFRWMIFHETMSKMIDGVIVYSSQIPGF